ncbi:MAG: class II aldolase/adducin family protein [Candidatus Hydrogenedentes bacterium]|nr:class II aldolase/adducin family protein [Candidatus Hydrogenedentota bacterium]
MDEAQARRDICEIGRRLYQRNLVAATDGNISIRVGPDRFLCTPSGVSKGFMQPEDLLAANGQAHKLEGSGKVTSEFYTHLAAYEERPDIVAVVHAHPPVATALTLAGLSLTAPILPEVVMAMGGIPTAPYATPGTREGANSIRELIRQCDALLLDRHGAFTVGKNIFDAYFKMEKLEHAAFVYLSARLIQ